MTRALLTIGLVLVAAAAARADQASLQAEIGALFAKSTLAPIEHVAGLPPDVARVLEVKDTFWMADPGESWNPGCVHDSSKPEADRRLIIAGTSAELAAVHYERGGRATYRVLELLRLSPEGTVELRCTFVSSAPRESSLTELRIGFPGDFSDGRCAPPDQAP